MKPADALQQARDEGLDLVEVAPGANPPVCKIIDFGKLKYQESVRAKEARKKQTSIVVKEVKFSPQIGDHDFTTKMNQITKWLGSGNKVKVTMFFRRRQIVHPELGFKVLQRLVDDLGERASVELRPKQEGRNITMVLAPGQPSKEA